MRLLNDDNDVVMKNVSILLTRNEAMELKGSIEQMLSRNLSGHEHINDLEYEHEITVAIYNPDDLKGFNARIKALITKDE